MAKRTPHTDYARVAVVRRAAATDASLPTAVTQPLPTLEVLDSHVTQQMKRLGSGRTRARRTIRGR
jgi:hypothetical protein